MQLRRVPRQGCTPLQAGVPAATRRWRAAQQLPVGQTSGQPKLHALPLVVAQVPPGPVAQRASGARWLPPPNRPPTSTPTTTKRQRRRHRSPAREDRRRRDGQLQGARRSQSRTVAPGPGGRPPAAPVLEWPADNPPTRPSRRRVLRRLPSATQGHRTSKGDARGVARARAAGVGCSGKAGPLGKHGQRCRAPRAKACVAPGGSIRSR